MPPDAAPKLPPSFLTDPAASDEGAKLLMGVLQEAYEQCTRGKGDQRHGNGLKLLEQQWVCLAHCHGLGFLTGQASKKLNEAAMRIAHDQSMTAEFERECLGAIVYAAFAVIHMRRTVL